MAPRRSTRLQSQPAASCVLPEGKKKGRRVVPGKPSAVPLNDVLEVTLLALELGDSTLALQVAVLMAQASRENRATVAEWRRTITRFHLDFASRELRRCMGGRVEQRAARQAFVLRQMWKIWAPHAAVITIAPRFRPIERAQKAHSSIGLLQLKLSDDSTTVCPVAVRARVRVRVRVRLGPTRAHRGAVVT